MDQLLSHQKLMQLYLKLKARNNNRRKECSQQQKVLLFNCNFDSEPLPRVLFHLALHQPVGSQTALCMVEISCTCCCVYLAHSGSHCMAIWIAWSQSSNSISLPHCFGFLLPLGCLQQTSFCLILARTSPEYRELRVIFFA